MPKRDGPITRQKERIASILQAMADNARERPRLEIQLSEANAALGLLTGKPERAEPELRLVRDGDV